MNAIARWLYDELGEGGVFTKQQIRALAPSSEQADRRMRDLRRFGWEIDTNREDTTLLPHELRLVKVGQHVWIPGNRSAAAGLSGKERAKLLARARYRCSACGGAAGEPLPASLRKTFVLSVYEAPHPRVFCQMCGPAASEFYSADAETANAIGSLEPERRAWLEGVSIQLDPEERLAASRIMEIAPERSS